jgi:hypothetical protein
MARVSAMISLEGEEGSDEFALVVSFSPELPKDTEPHIVHMLAVTAWKHIQDLSGTTKITSKDIVE